MGVFKSLKTHFNEVCRKFLQSNAGRVITIYDISQLVGEAWPQALTPVNLISGFSNSGIYPLNPAKITLEKLALSQLTNPLAGAQPKKSIDDILVVPQPTQKSSTATRRKPGLAISGRWITEAEFRKEMRETEAELLEIERQKQEKKAAKEKKRREREAEKERKKKEKEAEKERRLQKQTVKWGEDKTQDRNVPR